jgi:hypothetical protein
MCDSQGRNPSFGGQRDCGQSEDSEREGAQQPAPQLEMPVLGADCCGHHQLQDTDGRIEMQRAILTDTERDGHNGLVQARVLLEGLMDSQLLHRDYRQRILIEIKRNGL